MSDSPPPITQFDKFAAGLSHAASDAVQTVKAATEKGIAKVKEVVGSRSSPSDTPQSGGKKRKRTRRRGKKGGCLSYKWLKNRFSGSRKRKTGRKSRKHRR